MQALVGIADAYEPDDTPGTARGFVVETPQLHNFHASDDVDWVRFYVPSNAVYEIQAEQIFGNVDVRLDVWYQYADGRWTNIEWLAADDEGTGTVVEATGVDLKTNPDLPVGFYYAQVSSADTSRYGAGSDYELQIFNAQAGEGAIVVAADALNGSVPPIGAVAVINGTATQAFGTATSFLTNLPAGVHTVLVPQMPGYVPLWDLALPAQEANPDSYWFGNPKTVTVSPMQYNVAVFQFMPVIRAGGTVRDGLTSNGVDGARLAFTVRGGVLSNAVFDGFPGQAAYRTLWTTRSDGTFPTNVWLPATDWDLTITRPGYADQTIPEAILSIPHGTETNTGVFTLSPNLTVNGVPEWWLMKFGWSNDFVSAATNDADGDGVPTWREWVSDTDPTNAGSSLRLLSLTPDANGTRVYWQGGAAVRQYLERSGSLTGIQWFAAFTNTPPTLTATNVLDPAGTNPPLFYRIKAER
jgi:hypothetical protein